MTDVWLPSRQDNSSSQYPAPTLPTRNLLILLLVTLLLGRYTWAFSPQPLRTLLILLPECFHPFPQPVATLTHSRDMSLMHSIPSHSRHRATRYRVTYHTISIEIHMLLTLVSSWRYRCYRSCRGQCDPQQSPGHASVGASTV